MCVGRSEKYVSKALTMWNFKHSHFITNECECYNFICVFLCRWKQKHFCTFVRLCYSVPILLPFVGPLCMLVISCVCIQHPADGAEGAYCQEILLLRTCNPKATGKATNLPVNIRKEVSIPVLIFLYLCFWKLHTVYHQLKVVNWYLLLLKSPWWFFFSLLNSLLCYLSVWICGECFVIHSALAPSLPPGLSSL